MSVVETLLVVAAVWIVIASREADIAKTEAAKASCEASGATSIAKVAGQRLDAMHRSLGPAKEMLADTEAKVAAGEAQAKREMERIANHDCEDEAVEYESDGALGHGWECGVCGRFLQAG